MYTVTETPFIAMFIGGPMDGLRKNSTEGRPEECCWHVKGQPVHLYRPVGMPFLVSAYAPVNAQVEYVQVYRYEGIRE